jgi:hypothetical protein
LADLGAQGLAGEPSIAAKSLYGVVMRNDRQVA